jgi:hypothetical protein
LAATFLALQELNVSTETAIRASPKIFNAVFVIAVELFDD